MDVPSAVIDLQPLGDCEIWLADAKHDGDYCFWDIENNYNQLEVYVPPDDPFFLFHVTTSQLEIIPDWHLDEMVLGKWNWTSPGVDSAVIDLQPLGDCEIWFQDTKHDGDYCFWDINNDYD